MNKFALKLLVSNFCTKISFKCDDYTEFKALQNIKKIAG